MRYLFSLIIFLFLTINSFSNEYVNVKIVGYPKLDDFTIQTNKDGVILVNGRKIKDKFIHIYCRDQMCITKNGEKFKIKNISIESDGLTLFDCIHGEQDYRGNFYITVTDNKLSVINKVKIKDYLASVLGSEMGGLFSDETLKAQAVAVRTYFYSTKKKYSGRNYDIHNADGIDMVYRGASFASRRMYKIMEETNALFLVDKNGNLGLPLFHSTSGGVILKDEVMSSSFYDEIENPVLTIDKDKNGIPFAKKSPYFEFEIYITQKELLEVIGKKIKIKDIKNIKLKYFNNTECVDYIGFVDSFNEVHWIKAFQFVSLAHKSGFYRLRSIQFKVDVLNDVFVFYGNGFGHLCGMSQYSAEELAKRGYEYKNILKKYYPQYKIIKIDDIDKLY